MSVKQELAELRAQVEELRGGNGLGGPPPITVVQVIGGRVSEEADRARGPGGGLARDPGESAQAFEARALAELGGGGARPGEMVRPIWLWRHQEPAPAPRLDAPVAQKTTTVVVLDAAQMGHQEGIDSPAPAAHRHGIAPFPRPRIRRRAGDGWDDGPIWAE